MDFPVFINVFNRLGCLKKQLERLESMGIGNIILIDNNSSYPPLLKYLSDSKYKVLRLDKNYGCYALWKAGVLEDTGYDKSYYVYTDPDIVPIEECPNDLIEHLLSILEKYPGVKKAGVGLRIDNLPDNERSKKVIEHESSFWKEPMEEGIYKAWVDTTFCLYRPGGATGNALGVRTGYPYIAEHTPWYDDMDNLSEDNEFYKKNCNLRWTQWFR